MSVEISNVTRSFGQQKALDGVSFSVGRGEVVGLLGPNGAGKSTLMKIIACFIPQDSGEVSVCGFDVVARSLDVRRMLGYLPEHNPLYHEMYVREYLSFVGGLYRLGRNTARRVDEMIEQTGLGQEAKKKIGALSKGYRQRVGLAQALIHDPEVLILDEPTSGLDPNQLAEIRQLIKEIGKAKTVVLSTHIMQEVEAICDRVVILHKGRIVADAPTGEVRILDRAERIVSITFDKAPDTHKLSTLPGLVELIRETNTRFRIYADKGEDIRPKLFHFAVDNGLVILSMGQAEQSLEQVFRQLTL
ncbi:MAG: gliding motility-associated ABC transporter ATP-binding subunit GldA [Bacteroidales bacterium]